MSMLGQKWALHNIYKDRNFVEIHMGIHQLNEVIIEGLKNKNESLELKEINFNDLLKKHKCTAYLLLQRSRLKQSRMEMTCLFTTGDN